MSVIGFAFTKMLAEKSKPVKGSINVNNNVSIKDVTESKLAIDPSKKALKFEFVYTSKYEPEVGKIELIGELIYLTDEKTAKATLATWKKDKKLSGDIAKNIMNNVLAKCNVQAVVVSRDINLPAPIPLPKMK